MSHKCPQHQTPVSPTLGCRTIEGGNPCQFADTLPPEYFGANMSSKVLKTLRPGEVRYIPKIYSGSGRSAVWGIYDRAMASFPGTVRGRHVPQPPLNEDQATEHAKRLEEQYTRETSKV